MTIVLDPAPTLVLHRPCAQSGKRRGLVTTSIGALCLAIGFSAAAAATPSPTPTLNPSSGAYVRSSGGIDCFPTHGVCLIPGAPSRLTPDVSIFNSEGQHIVATVRYTFVVTDLALNPIAPFSVFGTLAQTVVGRGDDSQSGTWETRVSWLKLEGEFINGKPVSVALNPGAPSRGTATITPTAGGYEVTNRFEVNAALSVGHPFEALTVTLTPVQVELTAAP